MIRVVLTILFIVISLSVNANMVADDINQLLDNKLAVTGQQSFTNDNLQTEKIQESKNDFNAINKQYALVLFYRASCPHCQRFVPIVRQFSDTYGFAVYPYSVQGQSLPSFPNSLTVTNEIASTFFNSPNYGVPSLFLINTQTMKAYEIDQGEESFLDLYTQVNQFLQMIENIKNG